MLFATGLCISQPAPPPPAVALPTPTPIRISDQLAKAIDELKPGFSPSLERREKAYAKLLEGQRYAWNVDRLRSRAGRQANLKLAQEAFQQSAELDPSLSEAYTALAELVMNVQPRDADEAIRLASLGVKVNSDSFGARRILARLYTLKSRLGTAQFDAEAGQNAIAEWLQVVRLDPRNAEAWAHLSELYDRTGKTDESINSLRSWLASASPMDSRFAPENATLRLGSMLLKTGRTREAIETISAVVASEPANLAAVELLREAVEEAGDAAGSAATEALRQAVFANPSNAALVSLLAQMQAQSGNIEDAARLLRESADRAVPSDREGAAEFYMTLGDLFARNDRTQDAIAAYESAITVRGWDKALTLAGDDREFAVRIFEKMIQTRKNANQMKAARAAIERSRTLLGKDDLFADRQLISLLRETGNRKRALATIRSVRTRQANDQSLLRLEATVLTEIGRVDQGVALIRKSLETVPAAPQVSNQGLGDGDSVSISIPASDEFSNYLFISNLYSQANRGKDAIDAANQAYAAARGSERKQIARLTLATAQQMSGDHKGAESTLRDLLKETPGNPIALNNLGYFLLERDEKLEEAFDLIKQAVKIDPTNPSYLDSLGWAYFKLGNLPEAEKNLREALRNDSSSGTIHEHLGDVYRKQGKVDLARSSWSRAASLFSESADVKRVKAKLGRRK